MCISFSFWLVNLFWIYDAGLLWITSSLVLYYDLALMYVNCWNEILQCFNVKLKYLKSIIRWLLKVKVSHSHKGPYDFDLLVPVQELSSQKMVSFVYILTYIHVYKLVIAECMEASDPCHRQHLSCDDCRIRGKIIRTVLHCSVYCGCAQS